MDRVYTIPLRKEFQKAPRYKKSSKAIRAIKEFLKKHMKSDNIKLGKYLNEEIWKNGPRNPPSKVKVNVNKEKDIIKAELIGAPQEKSEENKKDDEKKVPTAKELAENKKDDEKKVPTAKELAENKKDDEKKVRSASKLKNSKK